jgi:hypothetical protein
LQFFYSDKAGLGVFVMKLDEMRAEFQKLDAALKMHVPAADTQALFAIIEEVILLNITTLESMYPQADETLENQTLAHRYETLSTDDIEILQEELFCGSDDLRTKIKTALKEIIKQSEQDPEVIIICKKIETLSAEGMARLDELFKQNLEDKQQLSSGFKA